MFLPFIPAIVGANILVAGIGSATPTVNIRNTCQAAASVSTWIGGGISAETLVDSCLSSEQAARDLMVKNWSTFSAADKTQCVRPEVYLPSYVEWLTCLEMERDVRKMRQQDARAASNSNSNR